MTIWMLWEKVDYKDDMMDLGGTCVNILLEHQ